MSNFTIKSLGFKFNYWRTLYY